MTQKIKGKIVIEPSEIEAVGKKFISVLSEHFPGNMTIHQCYVAVEAAGQLSRILLRQLEARGVKVKKRIEEDAPEKIIIGSTL